MNRIFNSLGIALPLFILAATLQPIAIYAQQEEEHIEESDLLKEGLPLTPERMLRRSFTEGSWISLDVSPDGEMFLTS
jgi:hypothetical protein